MKLIIIVAIGNNNQIGKDNKLLWHIKEDLQFFKSITNGEYIVMGRKTLESLPKRLPNRKYIVISKTLNSLEDSLVFSSVEEFINYFKDSEEKIYVIGGSSIYKELLPYTDEMFITHVNTFVEGDKYFPAIPDNFISEIIGEYNDSGYNYTRKYYKRRF